MKILFIAPVPPPVTGQSLAVKVLFDNLSEKHHVEIININKESLKSGMNSLGRIKEIAGILKKVLVKQRNKDLIYFTIAESFAGNMKDLLIYIFCYSSRKKIIIHMLGGAGMKSIIDKKGWQFRLNKFFISRLLGVIVEGQKQFGTFKNLIAPARIHVTPNFAEDFLFLSENEIQNKFISIFPVRILFLSNLIIGKGYKELVEGYLQLTEENKEKVIITFVGGFESDNRKGEFLKTIDGQKGLIYYGPFVSGNEKKALYTNSHIFCLPTYYPFEGQPISILEAYATGCAVITTDHSGIPDIFSNRVNGFEVQKMSPESIRLVIEEIVKNPDQLLPIAISNRNTAFSKYRTSIYAASVIGFFEKITCYAY
jgi:glycosyltransferase involved in cell wall biosynthesis